MDRVSACSEFLVAVERLNLRRFPEISLEIEDDCHLFVTCSYVDQVSFWVQFDSDSGVIGLGAAPGWLFHFDAKGLARAVAIMIAAVHGEVLCCTRRGVTWYKVRLPDGVELIDRAEGLRGFLASRGKPPVAGWGRARAYGP